MKWFVIVTVFAVTDASVINNHITEYQYGDRYFFFPDDNNQTLHLVDTEEPIDEIFLEEYAKDPKNNKYWLYTRTNPDVKQVLLPHEIESILNSSIDFSKVIVVLAHGWKGNGENKMNELLTKAFILDNDVNVIVLDWSSVADKNYVTAKRGVPAVGKVLGEFLTWMTSLGASFDKMHLVGFSLGAHLVGCAGRETKSRVKRITGLDPAGVLWEKDDNRLQATYAQYVEVIHTNTLLYGFTNPCGDADFYPNGGSSMPGCWLNMCSHSRSYEYMAASVVYDHFLAHECDDMNDMKKNNCTGTPSHMGNNDLTKTRSGIFRVNTGKDYPF